MDVNLPFPRRGLNDNWSFEQQPTETTVAARNVRSVDPTNRRTRGAQRSGLAKHYESLGVVPGSSPVLAFESIVYDNKTVTYDAIDDADLEAVWSKKTEANTAVRNLQTDAFGNLYAITGKALEKRNPDGALLWAFTVPVENDNFTLGPLAVGADLGVYLAVDGGAPSSEGASVYRVNQQPVANSFDTEPVLAWQLVTDRWVREIRLRGSDLVILEQDDKAHQSFVSTITATNLPQPIVQGTFEVPYPSTCMAVKSDGTVYTGHPYAAGRDSLPLKPGVGLSLESWTPDELTADEGVVWADLRAEDLLRDDGEAVNFWGDRSGNARNLYAGVQPNGDAELPAPTYRASGSTNKPSVYFDGSQGLFSLPGGGHDAQRDSCKTLVPNHGDGAYAVFIVCRPETSSLSKEKDDLGEDINAPRWVFDQLANTAYLGTDTINFDNGYNEDHRSALVMNSEPFSSAGNYDYTWSTKKDRKWGSYAAGKVRAMTSASGLLNTGSDATGSTDAGFMPAHRGAGYAAWPAAGEFDDPDSELPGEGLCVLTFLHCGGLSECLEISGTGDGLLSIALDEASQDLATNWYENSSSQTFELFIGATSYGTSFTFWGSTAQVVDPAASPAIPSGPVTARLVPVASGVPLRNLMSRSLLRVNGKPVDRWEALPMSYAGADGTSAGNDRHRKNVDANPTGLGWPMVDEHLRGFRGEIMQVFVLGRRQDAAGTATLTVNSVTDTYWSYPTVCTHPFTAANQRSGESADPAWFDVGVGGRSSTMEKIEGWLAHRHGFHAKLSFGAAPATDFNHPHAPFSATGKSYDIPLLDNFASSGQAWIPRKRSNAAMVAKHDQAGKMLWCLLSEIDGGNGDIVYEDLAGTTGGALRVSNSRPTCGIELGPDGEIFLVGAGEGSRADEFCMVRITDDADGINASRNPALEGVGWWYLSGSGSGTLKMTFPEDVTIRPRIDEFGNVYIPLPPGTLLDGVASEYALRVYGPDAAALNQITTLGGAGYQGGYAVALPPTNPDYYTD